MKRARAAALIALLLCGSSALADDRSDFQTLYDTFHAAVVARDEKALRATFDSDFASIDLEDKRKLLEDILPQILGAPAGSTGKTTVLSVSIAGDIATVMQRYDMTQQQMASDGKNHTIALEALSRDLWERHGGKWLIQETRTDGLDLTIDGVKVGHKVRP
ncbi:nuclear transport factor 2 family protein [Aestuariivirga sp.]|uniref:nuclear transport factor 2 family protein n=1 Tax=Aestuariivirga sp. TaxID=2650926 RepID=UPI0039E2BAD9